MLNDFVDIEVFSLDEALAFMRKRLKRYPHLIENESELIELIDRLDRFPLAIEQATAYMWRTKGNGRQYLELINKGGFAELENDLAKPMSGYKRTITEIFLLSYSKLRESTRQLFNLCTYMSPDDIPIEFFRQRVDNFPEPLRGFLTSGDENELIAELIDYSLVKRSGNFFSLHRFVQEVGREHLSRLDKDGAANVLNCCLEAVVGTMPDGREYGTFEQLEWFRQMSPHAEIIADQSRNMFVDSSEKQEEIGIVCHRLGVGHRSLARHKKALEWLNKALVIREKVLGEDHPDLAATCDLIMRTLYDQGKYNEALEWIYRAVAIQEKTLGKEHLETIHTYNNIVCVQIKRGDYISASEWLRKVVAIVENVYADMEHRSVFLTFSNIAIIHTIQGNYTKALEWHYKTLSIREKALGKKHYDVATSHNHISCVLDIQGKHSEALAQNQKAFDILVEVLGKEHPETVKTYNTFANIHNNMANYSEAFGWCQKALAVHKRFLGENHPETATTYHTMGSICYNQGDYDTALEWHYKALIIREAKLGENHPRTIETQSKIDAIKLQSNTNMKLIV